MRLDDIPFEMTRAKEPPAPGLAELRDGQIGTWTRYHLRDRAIGWSKIGGYHVMRALPPEIVGQFGAGLGRIVRRTDRDRPYAQSMIRGIEMIRPELDAAERRALFDAWWLQAGTTMVQYASLDKLATTARLTIHGRERIDEADRLGRTIYVMVHLGNWELIAAVIPKLMNRPAVGTYQPEPSRYDNRIVYNSRRRQGTYAFPPDRMLPRALIALINGGANLTVFIDEVSDDRNKFPLWGREVPETSNLIFALKLAHKLRLRLQPAYFLRDGHGRASLHLPNPLEPPSDVPRARYIDQTARQLSALFEPIIAENLTQWYMLHSMRLLGENR